MIKNVFENKGATLPHVENFYQTNCREMLVVILD